MLASGARIAVVSPSANFDPARLAAGIELLRSWGYAPECLPGVGRTFRYLAADDATRGRDLAAALTGDWDAVWVARGGFGMARLLDRLPWDSMRDIPVFGFSDTTALLVPRVLRGLGAVHSPVLHSVADHTDEESRAWLRSLCAGEPMPDLNGTTLRAGRASGPLVGGNVCVLASLCGTPWQLRAKGSIVVLEEIAEAPYKVDRLLQQLVQSGALDGAAGFVLGTFLGANPPEGADWTMLEVIDEILAPFGVPVLAGLPIGHGPANRAFVMGRPASIAGSRLQFT